ncbi:MAG: hypothetical protein JNL58_12430 [Planctomyces sp.]|nr:hypothetical protein [Planctomyces sp.]
MTQNNLTPGGPPSWLRWFINDASRGFVDHESLAPIGCHFYFDDALDVWEVSLFVSNTELVGGPADGRRIPTGTQVDINLVKAAFDSEPTSYWQAEAIAEDDDLGNHLSFEGIARGHQVWLRILAKPPVWAGPGRVMHTTHGVIEDLW